MSLGTSGWVFLFHEGLVKSNNRVYHTGKTLISEIFVTGFPAQSFLEMHHTYFVILAK